MGAILLSLVLWATAGLAACAALHLWAWALVGLLCHHRNRLATYQESDDGDERRSAPTFAVLIPAHNEEARLPALLESLAAQDYPRARYEVWVIADNCTDGTAEVAARAGVRGLRRTDPAHPGKGQALEFALARLDASAVEAVVVLDADSVANPGLLSAFAEVLQASGPTQPVVLQASSRLRAGASAQSLLLAAESALEDRLYYGAKGRVGFPVLLRGGGMCLTTALLRVHPWHARSVGEDVEYAATLLIAGIRPQWIEGAVVSSAAPERRGQFVVQRARWGAGQGQAARRYGLRLLWRGIARHDLRLCDAGIGFFVTCKSALLAASALVALLAWLLRAHTGAGPAWLAAAAASALLLYGLVGVALCRPSASLLARAMVAAPALLLLRLWVHARGLLGRRPLAWERTPE